MTFPKDCPTTLLRFWSCRIWCNEKPNKTLVFPGGCLDLLVGREGERGGRLLPPGMLRAETPHSAECQQPLSATPLFEAGPRVASRLLGDPSAGDAGQEHTALRRSREGGLCHPPLLHMGLGGEHGCEVLGRVTDRQLSVAVGMSLQPGCAMLSQACCPINVSVLQREPGVGRGVHAVASPWGEIQIWSLNSPQKNFDSFTN